ncbi:MAG: hypothetical protein DMF91_04440 [Acidobacteria bacterium]|nr:MAG: hypothetical protein DMF91_04440 [Acidobacteriota bacterium]
MRERSVDRPVWSWRWIGLAVVGCVLSPGRAAAQPAASGPLSLNDAIQLALKNYPAIKESRARAQAADAGIGVARTAFLPRLDLIWQENRATTNNIFGVLLPQSTSPIASGAAPRACCCRGKPSTSASGRPVSTSRARRPRSRRIRRP